MPMRVDVVERQSGSPVGLELRGDFPAHLPLQGRVQRNFRTVKREVVAEVSVTVDETRNVGTISHRIAVDENNVKPDAQARQRSRARDRVGRRGRADHEARSAENAAPVRCLDGGVDWLAEPEIVRRDDQPVQCAISRRSRRNEKNSTPSRNRRTIISGLRTISDIIDAILGARK